MMIKIKGSVIKLNISIRIQKEPGDEKKEFIFLSTY